MTSYLCGVQLLNKQIGNNGEVILEWSYNNYKGTAVYKYCDNNSKEIIIEINGREKLYHAYADNIRFTLNRYVTGVCNV